MLIDFEPGDYVTNPANRDWGVGQVQSIIGLLHETYSNTLIIKLITGIILTVFIK